MGGQARFPVPRKGRSFLRELPAGRAEVLRALGSAGGVGGHLTQTFKPSDLPLSRQICQIRKGECGKCARQSNTKDEHHEPT